MIWEKIKSFFKKSDSDTEAAQEAAPAPQEKTAKQERVIADAAAWTLAPLDYFAEGEKVTVLKRARDYYLMDEENRAIVNSCAAAAIVPALEAAWEAGDAKQVQELAAGITDALVRGAVRLYDKGVKAEVIAPYLEVTAKPVYAWLRDHDLHVAYCSNCAYETMDAIWTQYPTYFAACGLVYICPQHTALQMLEANGKTASDYDANREQCLNDAFFVVRRIQKEHAAKNRSYVCLDADGNTRTYAATMELQGKPGHIVLERCGALRDAEHQRFAVFYPEGSQTEAPAPEKVE